MFVKQAANFWQNFGKFLANFAILMANFAIFDGKFWGLKWQKTAGTELCRYSEVFKMAEKGGVVRLP